MRKLIIIISVLFSFSASAQWDAMLLASQQQAGGSTPLYTNLDAANPVNETNSASGWTVDLGDLSVAVDASDKVNGSYSLKFTQDSGTNLQSTMLVSFTAIIGHTYQILVDAKRDNYSGVEIWLRSANGWTTQVGTTLSAGSVGVWGYDNTLTSEASSTSPSIRFGTTSGGDSGHSFHIDNIRIIDVTP